MKLDFFSSDKQLEYVRIPLHTLQITLQIWNITGMEDRFLEKKLCVTQLEVLLQKKTFN